MIPSSIMELAPLEYLKHLCLCDNSSTYIFDWILFLLSFNKDNHKAWISLKFWRIRPGSHELAALERLEKSS